MDESLKRSIEELRELVKSAAVGRLTGAEAEVRDRVTRLLAEALAAPLQEAVDRVAERQKGAVADLAREQREARESLNAKIEEATRLLSEVAEGLRLTWTAQQDLEQLLTSRLGEIIARIEHLEAATVQRQDERRRRPVAPWVLAVLVAFLAGAWIGPYASSIGDPALRWLDRVTGDSAQPLADE